MGKHGSSDVLVLVGGYNATGVATTVTNGHEGVFEDTTAFGVTDATSGYVGLKRGTFTQGGFYDDTALSINDELQNLNGTDQVTCLLLAGNTFDAHFVGYKGVLVSKYDRQPALGKFTRAMGTFQVDGIVEDLLSHCFVAYPLGTANSASGTGSVHDYLVGGSATMTGYLQVTALALGDRTNLVVKLQHSTDNSIWADLITFTAVTAAPNAQRIVAAPNINRYVRVSYAWTGGSTGQSATIFVGQLWT